MKVAVYIGINELPLNKVQKAAVKLMQCDLKFLYIILYGYYKILAIFSVLYNTPL